MLLKDVCVLEVVSCGRDTRISEAAQLMRERHCGDLVVVDDPRGERVPAGILTDRDIVVEVLGKGLDPATTTVAEVMTRTLAIALDTEGTDVAIERMRQHGVRRLPVVNHAGGLVGIFTLDDALRLNATHALELIDVAAKGLEHERRTRR
ncbi:MAG: CBS domain-containing protein [Burkholderiales bacterium]